MSYRAPVADMLFTLKHTAGFARELQDGVYGDLTSDVIDAVLEEAGRFATDVQGVARTAGNTAAAPYPKV